MNRADSIFRNTAFIFIAKIIDLIAALTGFILVARYLGVDGLGRYSFVMAFVLIFGLVVNLGIDHIIIREAAGDKKRLPFIIGAAVKLKFYLLLLMVPLFTGGLLLFGLDSELRMGIIIFALALILFRELFTVPSQAVFLGCERLEYRTITTFVFQLLRTGGIAAVLLTGRGLVPVFTAILIADIVQAGWTVYIVNRFFAKPDFSVPPSEVKYLFRQALPIGLAYGFTTAFLQLDILLLKGMRGDYENGIFTSAYRVISTLILVVVPMIWVLLPHLTRTFNEAFDRLKSEGQLYLKFIAVAMLPAAIIIGIYSTWLITLAFGAEYSPAGRVLTIVAPVLALRTFSYLFDLTLTAAKRQIIVAVGAGVAFTSKLIIELFLIPGMGYMGAAWANLAADIISFTTVFLLVRHYVVKYNLWASLARPIAAGAVTLVILWFLRGEPLWGIPLGLALFFGLILAFGTFDRHEREIIISLISRSRSKFTGNSGSVRSL